MKHCEAYKKIFDRCNLKFFVVGASSGSMGGKQSQEFMVESDAGEDVCVVCDNCGYAANLEVASSKTEPVGRITDCPPFEEFPTPNARTIDDLIEQFNLPEDRLAKSVVYIVNSEPVLIFMRGNDGLNESKLEAVLGTNNLRPAEPEELAKFTGANTGSIGPINLKTRFKVIADNMLKGANGLVSGANKDGFHFKNIDFERDCTIDGYYDLRTVSAGESCSDCGSKLRVVSAIELGHIFKLGTKYSVALGANFLDAEGKENPIIMGSYGIGVERILACYLEQHHDEHGIIWKSPLMPYHVHLLPLGGKNAEAVKAAADKIYEDIKNAGFDVLIDDRDETPGVKFNDADLIGIPVQIIVGKKNLDNGNIEVKVRETGAREAIPLDTVIDKIKEFYK
jgi:prolyl-tRNA synthetase